MQTRFSTRAHQRVAYDVAGPAGAPVVVLLHDLLGQRSSMAAVRDALGDDVRRVSVDLRGHGASATISGAAIDLRELALDVAGVLDQEGIHTAVIVGHGLGGAVARCLAIEAPGRVSAIVDVVAPSSGLDGEPLAAADARAAGLAYKGLVDGALAAYLNPRLGPTWRDDQPRPTVAALRRHAPALATLVAAQAAHQNESVGLPPGVPVTSMDGAVGRLNLSHETVTAIVRRSPLTLDEGNAAP